MLSSHSPARSIRYVNKRINEKTRGVTRKMRRDLPKIITVKHTSSSILILICLSILMTIGCQSNTGDLTPEPTSSLIWTTTKDINRLQPLLFIRDDLGWERGEYAQWPAEMSLRDIPAEDVAGVYLALEPRVDLPKGGSRRGSILGASQLLWIYSSEEKAIESIEFERERFSMGLGKPMEIEPLLNNEITGCARAYDPDIKEYYNCNFMGQHGQYLTVAGMAVDGTIITLEDWGRFIRAIQDRMITQVEKDMDAYPSP